MTTTLAIMNVVTLGVTEWDEPAIDVAESNGVIHILEEDGLWAPTGDPAVVASSVKTGYMDFYKGNVCAIPRAYPKIKVNGDILLQAVAAEDGAERTVDYMIPDIGDDVARKRTIRLARGVEGSEWSFKIGGTAESFELRGLEVKPEWARRRRV